MLLRRAKNLYAYLSPFVFFDVIYGVNKVLVKTPDCYNCLVRSFSYFTNLFNAHCLRISSFGLLNVTCVCLTPFHDIYIFSFTPGVKNERNIVGISQIFSWLNGNTNARRTRRYKQDVNSIVTYCRKFVT
jgi:hypothetical protein